MEVEPGITFLVGLPAIVSVNLTVTGNVASFAEKYRSIDDAITPPSKLSTRNVCAKGSDTLIAGFKIFSVYWVPSTLSEVSKPSKAIISLGAGSFKADALNVTIAKVSGSAALVLLLVNLIFLCPSGKRNPGWLVSKVNAEISSSYEVPLVGFLPEERNNIPVALPVSSVTNVSPQFLRDDPGLPE